MDILKRLEDEKVYLREQQLAMEASRDQNKQYRTGWFNGVDHTKHRLSMVINELKGEQRKVAKETAKAPTMYGEALTKAADGIADALSLLTGMSRAQCWDGSVTLAEEALAAFIIDAAEEIKWEG